MRNIHVNDMRRVVRQQQATPLVDAEYAMRSVAVPHAGVDTALDLQRYLMQLPTRPQARPTARHGSTESARRALMTVQA